MLVQQVGSESADPGQNLALADTNAHAFASAKTSINLAVFSAPLANTKPVYLGRASTVTTSTGIELQPGDSATLPCRDVSEWYAITGTATQNVHAVAL